MAIYINCKKCKDRPMEHH